MVSPLLARDEQEVNCRFIALKRYFVCRVRRSSEYILVIVIEAIKESSLQPPAGNREPVEVPLQRKGRCRIKIESELALYC